MKTYKSLLEEIQSVQEGIGTSPIGGLKRVEVRDSGRSTDLSGLKLIDKESARNVIGWFSNKHNPAFGWAIFKLDAHDKDWLPKSGVKNLKGVLRVSSEHGTNIVKFDLAKGTYAFVDGDHFEATDEARFEKMTPYKVVVLDTEEKKKYFL